MTLSKLTLLSLFLVLLAPVCQADSAATEQVAKSSDIVKEQSASHKVFKGSLYKIWVRLRAMNPLPKAERAGRGQLVVTAGIRASESTETALKPYWKDDRTEDKAFLAQVEALNSAQSLLDEGNTEKAKTELSAFVKKYPDGELLPNALFAQGLTFAATGASDDGVKSLKKFIKQFPNHPLKADAEQIIGQIDKS